MSKQDQKSWALVRKLAPGISPEWAEEFVRELRLRGVSGEDVGSALAEVESHCAESGEPVEEAFGPAADYARSLQLPASSRQSTAAMMRVAVPQIVQLLGMFALIAAAVPLAAGEPMSVTLGSTLTALLVALTILLLVWKIGPVLRVLAGRVWVSVVVSLGYFAAVVVLSAGLRQEVLTPSPWWGLGVGVVCLLIGTGAHLVRIRRSTDAEDVLTVPFEDQQEPGERRRQMRRAELAPAVLIPAFAVVMFLVLFLLG